MSWDTQRNAPKPGTHLCRYTDIPDGEGKEFVFGRGVHAFRMFVVRHGRGVWAYVNHCPHFPIPLNARSDVFVTRDHSLVMCAHHGARFRYEDGYCVDGPCKGSRLDRVPVRIENTLVLIGEFLFP